MDQQELLKVLSDLARHLVGEYEISDALHDLVDGATSVLDIAGAGISVVDDAGRMTFVTAATSTVSQLERVQEDHQAGACIDAHRSGEIVSLAAIGDQPQRWPVITKTADAVGMIAVAGIPMHLNGTKIGALNLYDDKRRDWTGDDLDTAMLLALTATAYVANTSSFHRAQRIAEQLQEALDTRVVIEQAKGILVATNNISVDAAFSLLRNHSRSHHAPLRTVASAVVDLGLRI